MLVLKLLLIFLLTVALGLLATWIDRKVTARLQYRQGPPWYQPWADLAKLLGKETIVPEGISRVTFFGAPLLGLAAAGLTASIIWLVSIDQSKSFVGDLIVVVYLLTLPSLAVILGGAASRNPLAAIGASREMKLILAYELPFILTLGVVIYKTGSLLLGSILQYQTIHGPLIGSLSGLLAFVAALLVFQAKLGATPFDIAEAEQEIAAGALLEYSGPALAVFRLTRAMLYIVLPLFLVLLFWGGIDLFSGVGISWLLIKYVIILVLVIVLKNTNPRLRSDQALRFFWGPVTGLAIVSILLAMWGL